MIGNERDRITRDSQITVLANTNREPHFSAIVERVATKLVQIYETASIPIVSRQRIIAMIQSYHKNCISINDVIKRENESQTVKARSAVFKQEAEKLFDVTACKCLGFNDLCHYPKDKEEPKIEQQFLIDQKTDRKMGVDRVGRCRSIIKT